MAQEKNKGLAAGAALGAAIGVVVGVLFAPKSGKETRQDIKDTSAKALAKLEEQAKKLQAELSDLIDKADAQFKDKTQVVTEKAKHLVEQARHSRDALTVLAKSVKAGEADDKDLDKAIKKAKESKDALATYLKK
jgi:gas vesicle protein